MTPRIGSLFSGYGGLDMAAEAFFGGTTAWVSDVDPGACKILAHRYPDVPNIGDITKVDWTSVEPIDVLTGGFPCQDLSSAGRRAGMRPGTRSGLWSHMAYAVSQLRPRYVVAENVRGLLSARADSDVEPCPWCVGDTAHGEPGLRALGAVLGDLAELGYDAQWIGLRASDVGAPHGRFRVFVVATDSQRPRLEGTHSPAPATPAPGQRSDPDDGGCLPRRYRDASPDADRQRFGWIAQLNAQAPAGVDGVRRGHPDGRRDNHRRSEGPGSAADRLPSALGRAGASRPTRALVNWGPYAPAVHRWEDLTGRPAPSPTEAGRNTARLRASFAEWMMGLPAGWVTQVPGLTRAQQLKAIGNGVVPQQAAAAIARLLADQAVAA